MKDWLFSEKFSLNSVCQGIRTKIQSEFSWVVLYIASSEDKFYFSMVVNDKKDSEEKLVTFVSTKGKFLLKLFGVGFL